MTRLHLLLLLLCTYNAYGSPHSIVQSEQGWVIKASLGQLRGTANEYVFDNNERLSQLIWETEKSTILNLGLAYKIDMKNSVVFDYVTNLNDGNANMTDKDWTFSDKSILTHYSYSKATEATNTKSFDLSFNHIFFENDNSNLFGLVGYLQDSYYWESYGGIYDYSVAGQGSGTISEDLIAVSYGQSFKSPYVGVGINSRINDLLIQVQVKGSAIVKMQSKDIHHLRDFYITGFYPLGNMISSNLNASYPLSENLYLITKINPRT